MEGVHESAVGNSVPPFLSKTYDMVDDPASDFIVSWSTTNNSFIVWNVPLFSRDLLPKYFKHSNFSSFVRQLNTYGFRKVDPDRFEFANEGFLRGQKHILKNIARRKPSHAQAHQQQPSQVQNKSVGSCVEVGKFGIEDEVEMLKRDKNVLMQELVRLRQQQQSTDNQLQTVGQRVQTMESRQQQMMSFLAKAMQSPGFVTQLVHQPNDSNRRISTVNKKRRLHNPAEENVAGDQGSDLHNGQIVKYQPLMNEAAKAVYRQLLKMHSSDGLEQKINGFLLDKMHSASDDALDVGSDFDRVSGVTFSDVLPASSQSAALLFDRPWEAICDLQPSHIDANNQVPVVESSPSQDKSLHEFSSSCILEDDIGMPDMTVQSTKVSDMDCMDSMLGLADGVLPVVSEGASSDPDALVDDIPKLLPGINDVFWEQFLSATSPLRGDIDEIESNILKVGAEDQNLQCGEENEWDATNRINHLTEQMGSLAAAAKQM